MKKAYRILIPIFALFLTGCGRMPNIPHRICGHENERFLVNIETGTVTDKKTGEEFPLIPDASFDYGNCETYSMEGDTFFFACRTGERGVTVYESNLENMSYEILFSEKQPDLLKPMPESRYTSKTAYELEKEAGEGIASPVLYGHMFAYITGSDLWVSNLWETGIKIAAKDCLDIISYDSEGILYRTNSNKLIRLPIH